MLIERNVLTQAIWCELVGQDGIRRAVPFENPVWDKPVWCTLGLHLLGRFAKGQRLDREAIRTFWILGEELSEVQFLHFLLMLFERLPNRAGSD
jgi:hypothetical protein